MLKELEIPNQNKLGSTNTHNLLFQGEIQIKYDHTFKN